MMRKNFVWKQNKKCEAKASDIFLLKSKKVLSFVSLGSKNNFMDLWKQNKKFDAIRC